MKVNIYMTKLYRNWSEMIHEDWCNMLTYKLLMIPHWLLIIAASQDIIACNANTPPQAWHTPKSPLSYLNCNCGSALVNMLAIMSSVGQYLRARIEFAAALCINLKQILKCLVQVWNDPNFARAIAPWLLEWRVEGEVMGILVISE